MQPIIVRMYQQAQGAAGGMPGGILGGFTGAGAAPSGPALALLEALAKNSLNFRSDEFAFPKPKVL